VPVPDRAQDCPARPASPACAARAVGAGVWVCYLVAFQHISAWLGPSPSRFRSLVIEVLGLAAFGAFCFALGAGELGVPSSGPCGWSSFPCAQGSGLCKRSAELCKCKLSCFARKARSLVHEAFYFAREAWSFARKARSSKHGVPSFACEASCFARKLRALRTKLFSLHAKSRASRAGLELRRAGGTGVVGGLDGGGELGGVRRAWRLPVSA